MFDVELEPGEPMTNDVLLQRLLPLLVPHEDGDGMIPGLDESSVSERWALNLVEPAVQDYEGDREGYEAARQDVEKWRAVKAVFDVKLTNVKYFDMGYRASPKGSLETGAVAHVFVGVSASGCIFAISGIDIWT